MWERHLAAINTHFKEEKKRRVRFFINGKLDYKCSDLVRGHGEIRFENGAYTIVREYFGPDFNTAIGQKMGIYNQVFTSRPLF